jgi:MFS family permease
MPSHDHRRIPLLLGLLFGLTALGSSSAAIALPDMAADLGVSTGQSAWALSLYALTLAVATAVHGRVADLVGIRVPLVLGVSLMAAGAVLGALAPSFGLLLAARLLQGAGAAAVPTLGVATITARFTDAHRAIALTRMAGVAAALSCLGPLIGGGTDDWLGWREVIAIPALGLLLLPLLWRELPTVGTGARLDIVGALFVAGTAAGLVLLIQSPSTGAVVAVAGAVLLLLGVPAVVMRVRQRPDGFLPVSVVRNAAVVRSALSSAAIPAAWFALLIAVPAVLIGDGWQPVQVGLVLVPSALTGLLAPLLAGPLLGRIGPSAALAGAGAIAAVALAVAAWGAGADSVLLLVVAVVIVTGAFGLGQPALGAAVGRAVTPEVRGVALGVATLVFLVGAGIGSAVVGGLGEVMGIAHALLLLALFPLAGVVSMLDHTRRSRAAVPVVSRSGAD